MTRGIPGWHRSPSGMLRPSPATETRVAWKAGALRECASEAVEQRALREILRVPLNRHHPWRRRVSRLGGFDDAIISPGDGLQSWCQVANCLVMTTVDLGGASAEHA